MSSWYLKGWTMAQNLSWAMDPKLPMLTAQSVIMMAAMKEHRACGNGQLLVIVDISKNGKPKLPVAKSAKARFAMKIAVLF